MRVIPFHSSDLDQQDQNSGGDVHIAIYLSCSIFFYEMSRLQHASDEYDVDFEDTTEFTVVRYNDILEAVEERLSSPSDRRTIKDHRDWQTTQREVWRMRQDLTLTAGTRRLINQFQPLPRTLQNLLSFFRSSVHPLEVEDNVLWGLVHLNLKLSYDTPEKLKRTAEWVGRLRSALELLNRCLETCGEAEMKETRIVMIEAFDPLLFALADSIRYLRSSHTDVEVNKNWPAFDAKVTSYLTTLNQQIRHLNDISNYAVVSREAYQRTLAARHGAIPEPDEPGKYPIQSLPVRQNPRFYGRKLELTKIEKALDLKIPSKNPLRTYTIYGRRGVGKTELALEYAYQNPSDFEATFWVGCETRLALRQSFTDIAIRLDLPRADKYGRHEENQLAVLNWLKHTRRSWLMIFDNAENEDLLKGYWPSGAKGAILITSRKYYNFMNDDSRKGDTVKPFNPDQSFELLCQLLGDDWKDLQEQRLMPASEIAAAKSFLNRLQGLGLAIQQAAILIKNEAIGGPTIETTFDLFLQHSRRLPERPTGKRSDTYHSLDTLWDMNFRLLTPNARLLLSVLSLLSPDTTYIELFLPRRQSVLSGKLAFCRQRPNHIDDESHTTLSSMLTPTPAFEEALHVLIKAELVKRDGRIIIVHRVVQEAMNYYSAEDVQDSFDAAVRVVAEAFPKRRGTLPLFEQWAICSLYIHDAVSLVKKFAEFTSPILIIPKLKGTNTFIEMIGNCAWYLYEISDYDGALQIIDTAYRACDDSNSLLYADLGNTAGACYFEKNLLVETRKAWEKTFAIRTDKLADEDLLIAAINHNMGNLETGSGNYERAMEYFKRSIDIRLAQEGDESANQLALLYLCIGRVESLKGGFDEATKMFGTAENLFVRTLGAEKHYMAHVHYAYGNVDYRRSNWLAARRSYAEALRISLSENPIHPITAAAYFSLGSVEFKLKHDEIAKGHLEKARAIAELRSPSRDDGTIARILLMLARVMENNVLTAAAAEPLRLRAEIARRALTGSGESRKQEKYDAEGTLEPEDEMELYNALVPVFFR